MARPGVKNSLFHHLGRRDLDSSNVLLLGVNNAVPVSKLHHIRYYSGIKSIQWRCTKFSYLYALRESHVLICRFYYNQIGPKIEIYLGNFLYAYNASKRYIRIGYFTDKAIYLEMVGRDRISVTIRHGPKSCKRYVRPFFGDQAFEYYYQLLVKLNGGPWTA